MSVKPFAKPQGKTHTRFGTPISPAWDEEWCKRVEETEAMLNKRICGACTMDGDPCQLFVDTPSGRCRYHGGFGTTGAQPGNRNATIHALFSRRLQDCGPHCPRFDRCPVAGRDVAQLPASNRPVCPYEAIEFNAAVTDLFARIDALSHVADDYAAQYARHVALLQVLCGRAARAIAAGNPAALDPFLRIAAEYRRCLAVRHKPAKAHTIVNDAPIARRREVDTALDPEGLEAMNEVSLVPARRGKTDITKLEPGTAWMVNKDGELEPSYTNLADFMKPILKQAEGVLEESLVPGRRPIPKKV